MPPQILTMSFQQTGIGAIEAVVRKNPHAAPLPELKQGRSPIFPKAKISGLLSHVLIMMMQRDARVRTPPVRKAGPLPG
jgi:hypothetical protein